MAPPPPPLSVPSLPPIAHKQQAAKRPRVLVQSIPGHEEAITGSTTAAAAMFELDGVLTTSEAQNWLDAAEALGFAKQGSGGAAAGEAFRDNGRVVVRDPSAARMLWERTGLREAFRGVRVDGAQPLGLSANLRLYRYCGGGQERFGKHVDGRDEEAEVEVAADGDGGGDGDGGSGGAVVVRGVTAFTLLIYLSGGGNQAMPGSWIGSRLDGGGNNSGGNNSGGKQQEEARERAPQAAGGAGASSSSSSQRVVFPCAAQRLVGGETKFYSSGGDGRRAGTLVAAVAPVAGKALLHLHGDERCLEHEGAGVMVGTKYVLRSDVVFAYPGGGAEQAGRGGGGKAAAAKTKKAGGSGGSGRRR